MKSSLRQKKRIKEYARHLPPVRRWFLLSATALCHCETPHFYTCCARVAARSSSAGHFSEEINTSPGCPDPVGCPVCHTQLQSLKPHLTLSSRIFHRGKSPFCTGWDASLEQATSPGKTTWEICQLDWHCYASQTSSHD